MLNLSFAGTLGADPEVRQAGQSEVTEFRVAVSGYDYSKREKSTTWLKVNVWGKRGAQLADLCAKGDKVAGCGQLTIESYTSRDGDARQTLKVTCQDLSLLGGRPRAQEDDEPPPQRQRTSSKPPPRSKPVKEEDFGDDDIPF